MIRSTRHRHNRPAAPRKPAIAEIICGLVAFTLGGYFMFAAVQGEFGLFRRVEIDAEAYVLRAEKLRLTAEVATLENLTHRLSDGFLDIDLLDERARDVLGLIRADEIVIR